MKPVLLSIGGSDSSGGAGIQADIKTFAALGVHGTSVITSVTAQNTSGVKKVFMLSLEAISAQLESLLEDFEIGCVKTGMLSSAKIVSTVADCVEDAGVTLVLDPVMEAEAGGRLLDPDAIGLLRRKLIPLARVVTPNIFEAESLTDIQVNNLENAKMAAKKIIRLGAQAVIVTGGHMEGTDLLIEGEKVHLISGKKIKGGNHGVGCTYSAAIAAFLAQGWQLKEAASAAKEFAAASISRSYPVGRGASPVNQVGKLLEEADRFQVLTEVDQAVSLLVNEPSFCLLIPEVGSNIGMAIRGSSSPEDIAAIEGRLVRSGTKVHQSGCVRFGASRHVARIILAAMSFDPEKRAAMNVRFSQPILDICQDMNLKLSDFDREHEPEDAKTMSWGTKKAIRYAGSVPDLIWDSGGLGKEPMIRLLGATSTEVASLAVDIAKNLAD
ncbi:MAG: bifunctional hydroxymethylpyrimidine kinase/phosphomethylpyrimidine kinase [Methanotrichaceae archaeon]